MANGFGDEDWERFDRLLNRHGSPLELEAIRRWVDADPARRQLFAALSAAAHSSVDRPRGWDDDAAWTRMRERMRGRQGRSLHLTQRVDASRRVARTAAAFFVVAAAIAVIVAGLSRSGALRRSSVTREPAVAEASPREVVTKRGERATLHLADGSTIVLGPESRLVIPARFNDSSNHRSRELELSGEAQFTVQHDSTRPFRVVTATSVSEDLGTRFDLSTYPEVRGTRLVVEEGAVSFGPMKAATDTTGARTPLVVLPGTVAWLGASGDRSVRPIARGAAYSAWTRGIIAFDATPLADAIPQLERWYDLDFTLGDAALRARRLTGSFTNASADRMLQQLAVGLAVRITQHGRSVRLDTD